MSADECMNAFTAHSRNCFSLTASTLVKSAALLQVVFFVVYFRGGIITSRHELDKMVDRWVSIYLQSTFMTKLRVKVSLFMHVWRTIATGKGTPWSAFPVCMSAAPRLIKTQYFVKI